MLKPTKNIVHRKMYLLVIDQSADDLQEEKDDGGLLPQHLEMEERQDVIDIHDDPLPELRSGEIR